MSAAMTHPNLMALVAELRSWPSPTQGDALSASVVADMMERAAQAISTLTAALDDAIVTLSAVRCVSLSPDWQDSGPHFHGVIGETLQRIATLTKGEGGKPSNTQEIEP